jgi:DNA-binding XRE family transcriptional regulator
MVATVMRATVMAKMREGDKSGLALFAAELRAARAKAGLSQEDLAARLNYSPSLVAMVEGTRRAPTQRLVNGNNPGSGWRVDHAVSEMPTVREHHGQCVVPMLPRQRHLKRSLTRVSDCASLESTIW